MLKSSEVIRRGVLTSQTVVGREPRAEGANSSPPSIASTLPFDRQKKTTSGGAYGLADALLSVNFNGLECNYAPALIACSEGVTWYGHSVSEP